jgi:hypothetical protein
LSDNSIFDPRTVAGIRRNALSDGFGSIDGKIRLRVNHRLEARLRGNNRAIGILSDPMFFNIDAVMGFQRLAKIALPQDDEFVSPVVED